MALLLEISWFICFRTCNCLLCVVLWWLVLCSCFNFLAAIIRKGFCNLSSGSFMARSVSMTRFSQVVFVCFCMLYWSPRSSWFLSLHPTFMMHGHKSLKFKTCSLVDIFSLKCIFMFIPCSNVSDNTICRYIYGRMLTIVLKAPGICHRAHRHQGGMPTVAMGMPGTCHRRTSPRGQNIVVALEAPKDTPHTCGIQHVT